MNTVIYLSNQQIQVVVGSPGERKIVIEKSYTVDAPEGSIINGMIMEQDLFVEFMKEFWAANKLPTKDVILVLNSSKFVGKTIEMPEMNAKKTHDFIFREFADISRSDNCLFSYLNLSAQKSKVKKVYAESIETEFINDYLDIFQEIGIHLKSIMSGESSLIGLTQMTLGKKYRTFSLIVAEGSILTTILWINGNFYYFNSTRSFHELDSEEYAVDMARSVSQLIQFMQAHQIEEKLECVVVAGIERSNLQMYEKAALQMEIETPFQLFESPALTASGIADVQKCLRPASGLVTGDKNVDLLKQYASEAKRKKSEKEKLGINVIPIAISAAVMILLFAISFTLLLIRKTELKQLEDYNNSPEVITGVAEYDMMKVRNDYLNAQYQAIKDIDENIQTYPVCDSNIMEKIEDCALGYASVSFDAFDAQQGTIQMTASSDTVDNINIFIAKLNQQDIFNQVDYTGYAFNETTQNWDIHVTCTLAESAGR